MFLILKITSLCNFKCDYCSASCLSKGANPYITFDDFKQLMETYDVDGISIVGGDPLCAPPSLYLQMLDYIDTYHAHRNTKIAMTSNLWDFHIHPEKWKEVFQNPRIRITTSFQSTGRIKGNGELYTEREFIDVYHHVLSYLPHQTYIPFISTLTKELLHEYPHMVELAEQLKTTVRINPVLQAGESSEFLLFSDIFHWYLWSMENHKLEYDIAARDIYSMAKDVDSGCPYSRNCYTDTRSISPDGKIHPCCVLNDTHMTHVLRNEKTYELHEYPEDEIRKDYPSIFPRCFVCPSFNFCNACFYRIKEIKDAHKEEEFCAGMKALFPRMKALTLIK